MSSPERREGRGRRTPSPAERRHLLFPSLPFLTGRAWTAHGRMSLRQPVWGRRLPCCHLPPRPSRQLASGPVPRWTPAPRALAQPVRAPGRGRGREARCGQRRQGGHRRAEAGSAAAAGRTPLPSLCALPNESSRTTPILEGEGHSFIYMTQRGDNKQALIMVITQNHTKRGC